MSPKVRLREEAALEENRDEPGGVEADRGTVAGERRGTEASQRGRVDGGELPAGEAIVEAVGVVSKLKCPVLLASEVSGYALMMMAVGKWGSRRDFQGCAATVFSTARRGRDFSSSGTPAAV